MEILFKIQAHKIKRFLPSITGASLVAQMVKNLSAMQKTQVRSLDWKDPQRRAWQPTPVFLPGECHGQRSHP